MDRRSVFTEVKDAVEGGVQMDQLQPGQIRQISQPVFNPNDGYYYNETRIIEPDGLGGYVIVSDDFDRSTIQFVDFSLPTPWIDNI